MKTSLRLLSTFAAFAVLTRASVATDQPGGFTPGPKQSEIAPQWNVWVEVLMIALPHEKAVALLPNLRSPDKIDGTVAQMLQAVEKKEATVNGWMAGSTPDQTRFVVETIFEQHYTAGFDVSPVSGRARTAQPKTDEPAAAGGPIFTTFEVRNTGATLEAEPTVLPGGEWINLSLVPQRVAMRGWDSYEAARLPDGRVLNLDHPQFYTLKTTTTVLLRNGERKLLAVHKLPPPDTQIEFLIVQATATPAK